MAQKSAISALHEYCAQKKLPKPLYDYIDSDDGSYVCRVEVMDIITEGKGQSKKDAKQLSASNLLKRLRSEKGMAEKSAVSALNEYCAQNKIPPPLYELIESEEDGSYICRIQVMNIKTEGKGKSKRDAKQLSASILMKRLRNEKPRCINNVPPVNVTETLTIDMIANQLSALNLIKNVPSEISDITKVDAPSVEVIGTPTDDMIAKFPDIGVQEQHQLPIFKIVQQGVSPDAPEFIALCSIASISRYGTSEKKKDPKQKAPPRMFRLIFNEETKFENPMQLVPFSREIKQQTKSNVVDIPPGKRLSERHNYFTNVLPNLKDEAKSIINNAEYCEDYERQTMDLFKALKIKPCIKKFRSGKIVEEIVQIETKCKYNAIFVNVKSEVYKSVLSYFRDMLD